MHIHTHFRISGKFMKALQQYKQNQKPVTKRPKKYQKQLRALCYQYQCECHYIMEGKWANPLCFR